MKYYKHAGKRKKKIPVRIIVAVVCCIVVFALTVIYGNYLLDRVGNSANREETPNAGTSETPTSPTPENQVSYIPKLEASADDLNKNTAFLNLSVYADQTELFAAIDELKTSGFEAFSVIIRDENLKLFYASDAISEQFGVSFDSSLNTTGDLALITEYAHSAGMSVTALFESCDIFADSDSASDLLHSTDKKIELDAILIKEIAACGFDEIILTGIYDGLGLNYANAEIFLKYLTLLRQGCPETFFGVIMNEENFRTATYAPQIERIAKYVDIILLDIREKITSGDTAAEAVNQLNVDLAGSISRYNLRIIIDPYVAYEDQRTALGEHNITNILELPADPDAIPPESAPTTEAPESDPTSDDNTNATGE